MEKNYSLLLFLLLLAGPGVGQTVIIDDNFEDGDFTINPIWQGDTAHFSVIDDSGNLRLGLDAPEGGSSYLSTSSAAAYGSWEFFVRFDYSTLSASNNLTVFLISDLPDLTARVSGYALKAGESGSDDVFEIARYDEGTEADIVLSGTTNINNGGDYNVRIERTSDGQWKLYVSEGYHSTPILEASGADNTYATSLSFGFIPEYTSTRTDKFFFDDIIVTKSPLELTSVVAIDNDQLRVFFTDNIDPASVNNPDFTIDNGIGSPDTTTTQDNFVTLFFSSPLPGGDYTLSASNVSDLSGTTIPANSTVSFSLFDSFAAGDIVINEFMYDEPDGLSEYVEILNSTSKRFNLAGWRLGDSNAPSTISSDTLVLDAHAYLVISPDTLSLFESFGSRNYLQMNSFPSLNNTSGDAIRIRTDTGILVDSLFYDETWGGEDVSLERRSASATSGFRENWGDSPNVSGGTPGRANEVSIDSEAPSLTDLQITDGRTLNLVFDERLKSGSITPVANYSISGGIGIGDTEFIEPDTVRLTLSSSLQNAIPYELSIAGPEDIFGNEISSEDTTFTYFEISTADSGKILINEFLPDPPPGRSEYIELYNPTTESFDLQEWTLNDNTGSESVITNSSFVLPPDSFVVLAPDNSLLNSFPAIPLLAMGSRFPSLNNSGDDIVVRNAGGTLLDSLRYTSTWVAEGRSTERRSALHSAVYRENWGISPAPNGGTPGVANATEPDLAAPTLESLDDLSDTRLRLTFGERLEPGNTTSTTNYQLTGGISVGDVIFSPPDTVVLQLHPSLQNGASYQLSITGVEDIFKNAVTNLDTVFTYFMLSEPDSGDVFINEFLYEPPEGITEYIEIFNGTTNSYDLGNWTINDNTGNRRTIITNSYILPPNGFVTIAPDSSLISHFPNLNLITMGSRFPSLNNSGDDIVLRDNNGILLDSLRYRSAWGGREVAMERKTTTHAAAYRENWGESPEYIGTPGAANTIDPDKTPPEFTALNIVNGSEVQLIFSETLESQSAVTRSNYSISPDIGIQDISASRDTLTLYLAKRMTSGVTYDVTVTGLRDIFGNVLSPTTRSVRYLELASPGRGDVVINEILFEGDSSGPEFVELFNRSSKNFTLQGWQLGDETDLVNIKNNIKLESGSYLVLTGSESLSSSIQNAVFLPGFPSLNDAGDTIYIRSRTGTTIDSLFYDESWGEYDGVSLERRDPDAASNDPSNWRSSPARDGQTAGFQNESFQPDESPPKVIFSGFIPGKRIEVRFNEFIELTPEVRFLLDETELSVDRFNPNQGNRVLLAHDVPQKTGSAPSPAITVRNLSDVRGNRTDNAHIPLSRPLKPGKVVINEIMFNPMNKRDDDQSDQSEYIELRNTGESAISMEGFILHDAPDENGEIRSLLPVNTESKWIPANGILLVHADTAAAFSHSKTAVFFELGEHDPPQSVRIDRNSLSLASSGDAIYLADSTGATVDSVFYDEDWHNPNLFDTRGIALERINPHSLSSDPSNWSSSTNTRGGTPGSENSIFQTPDNQPANIGISFNPNPFSPDEDGYEDNLFINYRLDQPDYLLKVRIFDRYGRLVRELADGRPSGFEGSLIWDGKNNEGNKNRIGIYIVLFEAYNSNNGRNRTFKEVVVLARKF